jgi:geranylgeranyl diphosphate synthase type II
MTLLDGYRKRVEEGLKAALIEMGEKSRLRDACEYILCSKAKRIRPLLVLMIADALFCGADVLPSALGVEFFHTASLIADDLPCMDNDDFRRGRPTLHKVFGESLAILSSYTLIAAGYEGIYKNAHLMKKNPSLCKKADDALFLSLGAATQCAGIQGATNGQFLDLFPPDASQETICKIIYQKTGTLFEIAFIFGWLFGGGDPQFLEKLRSSAHHLGMAFQIADDLADDLQDASLTNVVRVWGKERASLLFHEEIAHFKRTLKELNLWTAPFQEFYSLLFQTERASAGAIF